MDTFQFIDIYATKGIEYLIVITFLVSIVLFHKYFISEKATATQGEGLISLLARKAHLGDMRWNPVMAHMKHPQDDAEVEEKNEDKNEKKSD